MSNALGAFRVEPANALKPQPNLSSHNYRLSAYERLSDLYPERYPSADGYVTNQPLDATEPNTCDALALADAGCTAIITNTPHNTPGACAIVRNLVALVEGQQVEFAAALFRSIWALSQDDWPISTDPPFFGEILCC